MVLDAATKSETRTLDTQLDSLMNQLHSLICQPVDYSNNDQVKNQNELLRCFAMLSKSLILTHRWKCVGLNSLKVRDFLFSCKTRDLFE